MFGVGRTVRVRGRVSHGVIAFGGDVVVEGRVEGDVATVGGSVSQKEGSYVGGDVIILGGTYHHGKTGPGRNPASNTIMFAGYEEELRGLARDPSVLLTPEFSLAFVGLRLLGVLLWFVVSLGLTAISPGAVSRGAARLQLTSLRVAVIGVLGALVAGPGVFAALHYLPPVLGVFVSATALLLLLFAYVFGRVCIYAATGQLAPATRPRRRQALGIHRAAARRRLLVGAAHAALRVAVRLRRAARRLARPLAHGASPAGPQARRRRLTHAPRRTPDIIPATRAAHSIRTAPTAGRRNPKPDPQESHAR